MRKKNSLFAITLLMLFLQNIFAQQISIPRIDEMPDMPQPYEMRDWKTVGQKYDELAFNLNATGQFLPLITIVENTTNYPEHPTFGIQSYVGTNTPPGMEAINVIPAVIGATLSGIDKSNQQGYNWPLLCEEYFNRRPSENVYLNGPHATSGHDWWYETMPNVFFYQLNYLYPHTGHFDEQFITVADRWLEAVKAMDGNDSPWQVPYMNYRAFSLSTMTPLESGVKEPEAAGAIGWLLYNAFVVTGEEKYRVGAEWCLEFFSNWNENPSYELQLPYGIYTAARMNAELGTRYDMEKMVNWSFDVGPLRNWGAIVGTWGGTDVSGLIGEARDDSPDYAFVLNGFEQAGALVPMVRYDDRFAGAIGKWVLNVANASRLYYSNFLSDDMEDNEEWITQYDQENVIAYEALREKEAGPYGTGDAMNGGWAQTNLGLYGSSHVGIMGAIIKQTNVEGILQLDMLTTDYYRQEAYPTYLFYNPYPGSKTVVAELPEGNYDIYDAVSNEVILTAVTGTADLLIPAGSTMVCVYIPANAEIEYHLNKAMVQGIIIDYNTEENVVNYPPRIKSLAIDDTVALINTITPVFCTAEDRESTELTYQWFVNGDTLEGNETLNWPVPVDTGYYEIRCVVSDEGSLNDEKTITVKVVEKINFPPVIEEIIAQPRSMLLGETSQVTCIASDANGDELTYFWHSVGGSFTGSGNTVNWQAPDEQGAFYIHCIVTDVDGASTADSLAVLVKDPEQNQTGELVAKYEFNGSAWDYSGNGHHGSISGCLFVEDHNQNPESALSFPLSTSKVTVQNRDDLNFRDGITVSFWINIASFFDREAYPISHGNWQNRWKISIGDRRLRFTINGESGITDLDIESQLDEDVWYHVVVLYNGWGCEIYINAELDAFSPYEGQINTTAYDLVFGQSLPDQSGFDFKGILNNVRIYNYGIPYDKIIEIYNQELSAIGESVSDGRSLHIYPNPANKTLTIEMLAIPGETIDIFLRTIHGKQVKHLTSAVSNDGYLRQQLDIGTFPPGIYMITLSNRGFNITHKVMISK